LVEAPHSLVSEPFANLKYLVSDLAAGRYIKLYFTKLDTIIKNQNRVFTLRFELFQLNVDLYNL